MSDLAVFEALAVEAYEALPEDFRALTGEVQIRVAEAADEQTLHAMGIDHPDDLLGLFEGVGLAEGGAVPETGALPNRVWLYRQAILRYAAEGEDTLAEVVRHVLVHEIGHHFGLSDEDMYAIDDAPQ